MKTFAQKFLVTFLITFGILVVGNAAVVSYFGKGAADELGVAIVNYLTGENTTFAQNEKVFTIANGPWEMQEIPTSSSDLALGTSGSTGDYLAYCYFTTTSTTATAQIEDGTNTAFDNIPVVPTGAAIGVFYVPVFAQATTAAGWEITTTGTASGYCAGRFDTSGD